MIRIELTGVTKGKRGIALPETDLVFRSGAATLVVTETAQRPTVLGLIASGRMRPDTGTVTLDGAADPRGIRRRVALVDAPDVSEPAPNIGVAGVVAEELMFAGRASDPISARRWMHAHELHGVSRLPIGDLAPAERVRILLELAAARPGVEALVLVSPDRHGGDPARWWRLADEFALRGLAVLVITGAAAATALTDEIGRVGAPAPSSAGRSGLRPSRVRQRRVGARSGATHSARTARPEGTR